jgi:hypothetical protein
MSVSILLASPLAAQHKISIDLGAIRQKAHHSGGMNISSFYHFNHQLLGGIEVNRFFPIHRVTNNEDIVISGWDFEMNFHYLIPAGEKWKFYPISGISHTSEKEIVPESHLKHSLHFWSVNTGAGVLVEIGKWLPHLEYNFTWGKNNQQFILAGVGYELEWGRHKESAGSH